jgi:hypothetical protein
MCRNADETKSRGRTFNMPSLYLTVGTQSIEFAGIKRLGDVRGQHYE